MEEAMEKAMEPKMGETRIEAFDLPLVESTIQL
jgi:hypothetical protein